MNDYEVTCIFSVDEGGVEQGRTAVKKELDSAGAVLQREDDMGNRELAYPIRKQTRGHYFCYHVQADPQKLNDIDQELRLSESVLKFLLVKKA